ncbi:hypothetical protein C2I18_04150 [Paenibacillus sp. PK3_47]|uniref:hypothetical protein n=1 Tax=Paenibacillus sp. PK3_47 TaxID=2072642 RepID=UPI00201DC64D|nr:hypothetical protein [Paenibacillus sp. PK3_47]UQZ32820.1 hypothetical protein C2I18_04150 [Paenibacillus sp. PK3_47]
MRKNKLSALAVILFSGGVLTLSALVVPGFVNSAVVAKNTSAAIHEGPRLDVQAEAVPVLKVEAPEPVSTVTEDLIKGMTEEQIRQIYDFLDKPGDPKVIGREMTGQDINRRRVLEDKFVYDGLRPGKQLPLKPGQGALYLDLETNTYYYPERSWTDEELLQLIDWSYRLNYISSKRNITAPPSPQKSGKAEAVALAADSVRKLFGSDVSKLKASAVLAEPGTDKSPLWMVQFAPYKSLTLLGEGKEFWEYHVIVDDEAGVVVDTTAFNPALARTPIDAAAAAAIQKDASWIHKATQIVMNKQGDTRAIAEAYLTDTEVNNKRGMVAVCCLKTEAGILRNSATRIRRCAA